MTILAHERAAIHAQFWSGLGLAAVDAIRDLSPVRKPVLPIEIRRAGREDIEPVMALCRLLAQHLAEAPITTRLVEGHDIEGAAQYDLVYTVCSTVGFSVPADPSCDD